MSTTQSHMQLTEAQRANLALLRQDFDLSDSDLARCLFFSRDQDEPWIPPDLLQAIARQHGGFTFIGVEHDKFLESLKQHFYSCVVIDEQGRSYKRVGVATIGERLPNNEEIDTHVLATGRALKATLTAAGFDPFKAASVTSATRTGDRLTDEQKRRHEIEDAAALRTKDLRQIHAIAEKKGLIMQTVAPDGHLRRDSRLYRRWLREIFGIDSAALLDAAGRQSIIEKLNKYDDELIYDAIDISRYPADLQQDALIA